MSREYGTFYLLLQPANFLQVIDRQVDRIQSP